MCDSAECFEGRCGVNSSRSVIEFAASTRLTTDVNDNYRNLCTAFSRYEGVKHCSHFVRGLGTSESVRVPGRMPALNLPEPEDAVDSVAAGVRIRRVLLV